MHQLDALSSVKCILLASAYAADSDITSLRLLTSSRPDAFDTDLCFRILLSFLPESLDPVAYTDYVAQVASWSFSNHQTDAAGLDLDSVSQLSHVEARSRLQALRIKRLRPKRYPKSGAPNALAHAPDDPLVLFLLSRAYKIEQIGLLPNIPRLLTPFLFSSEYLRTWFVSTILPLLRLSYEYHSIHDEWAQLDHFESLHGRQGATFLLSAINASSPTSPESQDIGQDLRGIIGPWTYGADQRKRRRLSPQNLPAAASETQATSTGPGPRSALQQDWEGSFQWIAKAAVENLPLATAAIQHWDGPEDVDTGGYDCPSHDLEESASRQHVPEIRYHQTAFASVYAAEKESRQTIECSYTILSRLSSFLKYDPPLDLSTEAFGLPPQDSPTLELDRIPKISLQFDSLLQDDHPLTTPSFEHYMLLYLLIHSAYVMDHLGYHTTIGKTAKLSLFCDESEQLKVLQKILDSFDDCSTRSPDQWLARRDLVLWLWCWDNEAKSPETTATHGVFCNIPRSLLEGELLRAMCRSGSSRSALATYCTTNSPTPLQMSDVERIVLEVVYHFYDNASNGNKTRGYMKRASDLLGDFRAVFSQSLAYRKAGALIVATHSLSFYALTLERGIPFQPARIRKSDDPVSLINQVLEQNPRSYTKLDDLINIGQKLILASQTITSGSDGATEASHPERPDLTDVSKRITGMAIEAALAEDDFETAYSYVVNRLSPPRRASGNTIDASNKEIEDDVCWRAAFHAGRHRTTTRSPTVRSGSPVSRHLEQRMELLAHSLSLAPAPALPDVLAAWRRCEEELLAVLSQEAEEEQAADDSADQLVKGVPSASRNLPGGFSSLDTQPSNSIQPRRKEIGRGAPEEAPMGLFEVARGAAAALGRSAGGVMRAGPQRDKGLATRSDNREGGARMEEAREQEWGDWGDGADEKAGADEEVARNSGERVRKRDMVASAVTGGLASGIGWVLGAQPVDDGGRS